MAQAEDMEKTIWSLYERLVTIARQRMGSLDRAEEAVAEGIAMCYQHEGIPAAPLDDFVTGMVIKSCNKLKARTRRDRECSLDAAINVPSQGIGSSDCDVYMRFAEHFEADLTHEERTAWGYKLSGYTQVETAQMMGSNDKCVRGHLRAVERCLRDLSVQELGFMDSDAMFAYCAHQHIYRAPTTTGSGLANERQTRLK